MFADSAKAVVCSLFWYIWTLLKGPAVALRLYLYRCIHPYQKTWSILQPQRRHHRTRQSLTLPKLTQLATVLYGDFDWGELQLFHQCNGNPKSKLDTAVNFADTVTTTEGQFSFWYPEYRERRNAVKIPYLVLSLLIQLVTVLRSRPRGGYTGTVRFCFS